MHSSGILAGVLVFWVLLCLAAYYCTRNETITPVKEKKPWWGRRLTVWVIEKIKPALPPEPVRADPEPPVIAGVTLPSLDLPKPAGVGVTMLLGTSTHYKIGVRGNQGGNLSHPVTATVAGTAVRTTFQADLLVIDAVEVGTAKVTLEAPPAKKVLDVTVQAPEAPAEITLDLVTPAA